MRNFADKFRILLLRSRRISGASIKPISLDRFLKKLPDVRWRPDMLFYDMSLRRYIALNIVYAADSFPMVLSQEVGKAKAKHNIDFFFIVKNESLLDVFEEGCRENAFGLILDSGRTPLLIREAIKFEKSAATIPNVGHYPGWILEQIKHLKLGDSKFKTALRDFSIEYLKLREGSKLDWEKEEALVKNAILAILDSDSKYTSGVSSLRILRRFEGFLSDIRDHYFHSFFIFLLGLLILDRYQSEFIKFTRNILPKYRHLQIEFLWLLTSIFHDVGYPISKIDELKEDLYGITTLLPEREIVTVWDDPVYKENLKQILSILKFSLSPKKHRIDWQPEVFGTVEQKLEQLLREEFNRSHGVAGCFRFLVDIFSEARREEDEEKKLFLIYHIYPAALAIALHDLGFRKKLGKIVKKIKLSRFPFAVLLMYLDSVQEDRRSKFLCVESPDLLEGLEFNGKVMLRINERLAESYPRLGKMKAECGEFINFVDCDGIKFEYPQVLSR